MRLTTAAVLGAALAGFAFSPALADGYKDCTKLDKASWKPAAEAEAKAKALGNEVRRSKERAPATKSMASRAASSMSCSIAPRISR